MSLELGVYDEKRGKKGKGDNRFIYIDISGRLGRMVYVME